MKPASPSRYDGAEQRRRALEAALEVFAVAGYDAASTRAIAAAAGMEQGHLAYYFPSKRALWQQVIEAFAREPERYLAAHLADEPPADPEQVARAVLPGLLRTLAANRRLARLMLQEFSVTSERHDWLVAEFAEPVWRRLKPLFEGLRAAGLLGGARPEIAWFGLLGAVLVTFGNGELIGRLGAADAAGDWTEEAIAHELAPLFAPAGAPC